MTDKDNDIVTQIACRAFYVGQAFGTTYGTDLIPSDEQLVVFLQHIFDEESTEKHTKKSFAGVLRRSIKELYEHLEKESKK